MTRKTERGARPESDSATTPEAGIDRRSFFGMTAAGAAAVGALATGTQAEAGVQFSKERGAFGGGGAMTGGASRSENELYDCEVDGTLPADLDGVFYRVGPDPQYPKEKPSIAFDGEGHIGMFRIKNGHVDYKSRYARNQRWKAQHAARRALFGTYRNPFTNDPSVKDISGGTANTQIAYHHNLLFALKEDSPPVAMNPLTLETVDDYYTFKGGMKGKTFTAHPKVDYATGEMICFGYEAKGLLTKDIEVFSANRQGRVVWQAFIQAPYVSMIHDFAVTDRHIAFLAIPLNTSMDFLRSGGPHWFYDGETSSMLGIMRRGGDGKDIRWFKGPNWMATHTMGAWSDGEKVYVDMDGAFGNQFPFFPNVHGAFDPAKSAGRITRMSVDLNDKGADTYKYEVMYPQITGSLARQDERYVAKPYRIGFLNGQGRWHKVDHQTGQTSAFVGGPNTSLAEMSFVPRNKNAPEGDGYLIGVATRTNENGRSDLVIVDTQHLDAGPVATVHLPYRLPGQVHGFWVPGDQLPKA